MKYNLICKQYNINKIYTTRKAARRAQDKLNDKYGSHCAHIELMIEEQNNEKQNKQTVKQNVQ